MIIIVLNTIANKPFKMINGITYFVSENEVDYNIEYAELLISGNWIEKNWRSHFKYKSENKINVAKYILSMGGPILEIGAGSGGGFMPYILDEDIFSGKIGLSGKGRL